MLAAVICSSDCVPFILPVHFTMGYSAICRTGSFSLNHSVPVSVLRKTIRVEVYTLHGEPSRVWCRVPVCAAVLLIYVDPECCEAGVTEFRKVVAELQAVPGNRTRVEWLCPAVPCAGISSLLEGL